MTLPAAPGREPASASLPPESGRWVWPAFAVALLATAGSLWLSIGLGLKACPLCFYQRTFVMSVLAVLGIGLLAGKSHRGVLCLLALPLSAAAFLVAAYHVYLELNGTLECPPGLLAMGTSPQQSLALLGALLALTGAGSFGGAGRGRSARAAAALALGFLLAAGAIASAPPMPPPPAKPHETPMDMCRPPFRAP